MVNAVMKIEKFEQSNSSFSIAVSFAPEKEVKSPRVAIVFSCEKENRRLPMETSVKDGVVFAKGNYKSGDIFYGFTPKEINISFVFGDGTDNGKEISSDLKVTLKKSSSLVRFFKASKKEKKKAVAAFILGVIALPFRLLKIKKNRVSFLTNRTDEPTGNLKAAYLAVSEIEGVNVKLLCKSGGAGSVSKILFKFLYLYMTSRVVYVDDYYHLISYIKKKKGTTLIQLWHGCGAFKTFGFSRYHKDSSLEIYSSNHRQYDYAIVSSKEVCALYAEAFGISSEKTLPLGSPRCDILTNNEYKEKMLEKFYNQYPKLKDKKILLFAPTFRGKGNGDCYYPTEEFNADRILDILGNDWAIVTKMHPYLEERITCSEKNKSRFADCSDWDINDLLFATDFLLSDYSSVIFEASILEIPMAFLAFDLKDFIEKRDFYYNFDAFVPGPIFENDTDAANYIKNGDFDIQRVKEFKQRAFDSTTGNACNNIKELTERLIK